MPRMISIQRNRHSHSAHAALALVSLALLDPSVAAADNEEIAELRRVLREVQAQNREIQAQNRELSRRLGALESARALSAAAKSKPASTQEQSAPDRGPVPDDRRTPASSAAEPSSKDASSKGASASSKDASPLPEPHDTTNMTLEERVKELEVGWAAQENATRQLIQNPLSKVGPNINSFLSLSGVVEITGSRTREFNGPITDTLALTTAELDFDIKLNNWLTGALVAHWESGTG